MTQYSYILNQASELATLVGALFAIIVYFVPRSHTPLEKVKVPADSPKIFRIIRLVQSTTALVWGFLRSFSIFFNIVILGYGVALIVGMVGAYIHDGTNFFSLGMIIILILLFMFPIISLKDYFETELRLRSGRRSKAFKWAEIEVEADYNSLLIRVFQVITDMGARVTYYDVDYNTKFCVVEAEFPSHNVILSIRALQDTSYMVYISSDNVMPTARTSIRTNQKIVNECATKLLGYR
jgi:multisubunit Na+/H+ antiporter MnhE subunit